MSSSAAPLSAEYPEPVDPYAGTGQAGLPGPGMAAALRALAVAVASQAGDGSEGLAGRMAEAATVLWTRLHRFDAADPRWPDRDRFVVSAGAGAPLLYGLLHLTGHDGMGLEALRAYRIPQAICAAHPDAQAHPAIEVTCGRPGQGLAAALGMALAERLLAARFGRSLVDHRTWVIADDADLQAGLGQEAMALAGHWRLGRLTVLWDDCGGEEQLKRCAATGWATARVDAADGAAVAAALSMAVRSHKPTLIACCSRADGDTPPQADFTVREAPAAVWQETGARGEKARRAWLKRLAANSQRTEFERVMAGNLPATFHETAAALRAELAVPGPAMDGYAAHRRVLEALVPALPELVGCAAAPMAETAPAGMVPVGPGHFAGRFIAFGARPHAMAAAMVGMVAHGGLIPVGEARLVQSDDLRPALRLLALMRARAVLAFAHDGATRDGAAWQPAEHVAALRAMPGLFVFRPSDGLEAGEAWELALRRFDGPTVLALGGVPVPALRGDARENRSARGGYVLAEAEGPRRATLLATGAELPLALEARAALAAEGVGVAVAALPCWDLFALQDEAWRNLVLGFGPRLALEAGGGFGWERWADEAIGAGVDPPQLEAVLAHLRRRLAV